MIDTPANRILATRRGSRSTQWWAPEIDLEETGTRIGSVLTQIRERTRWRRDQDLLHATMYGGDAVASSIVMDNSTACDYVPATVPRNVTRQAVETLKAKVAKHRPLPQVLTDRGDWRQQKRARKSTQFLEGVFIQTKFFAQIAPMWVGDAGIFGRGIIRPLRRGKKIHIERVHPWEVLVDDWDSRYGDPRSIYYVRTIDMGVAKAMFAKGDEEIAERIQAAGDGGTGDEWDWRATIDSSVDRVRIVEGWHLCDDDEAHDEDEKHECNGRHVISLVNGQALRSEPWDKRRFPFVVLSYLKPLAGFWGSGLAELLEPWQAAISEQFEKVQEGHRMLGGGLIFAQTGSDVKPADFTNGPVPIIYYTGVKPTFEAPLPVNPAVYTRERDMPIDALAEVGLTQTSVQGQKQAGINSGVAINAMDDIEDERHMIFGRQYEDGCLEVAELFIDLETDIAKEYGEAAVSVPMKGGLLPLKWSEVKLDDFQLRVFPTSMLPQQLAAKLEYLNFLFDRQLIDRQTFLQQLGGPDMAAELDLETADRLNIDEKLEAILDAETPKELAAAQDQAVPSPFQDLQWYQKRAQQKYNLAQSQGHDEDKLQALREVMQGCKVELDKLAPPPAAAPPPGPLPPPPGPPPGPPGPPQAAAAQLPIGNA